MVHPKTKPYASARMGAYAVKGGRALTSRRAETRCFSVLENVQRTNPNGFFTPPNPDCARPPPRKPLVCVKLTVFTPYMPSVRPNFLCPAKFRQRNGRRIALKGSLILDGTSQTGSRPLLGQACHRPISGNRPHRPRTQRRHGMPPRKTLLSDNDAANDGCNEQECS